MRFDPNRKQARFAVLAHVYYPDLWPEFATRLAALDIDHDLFVTLTWRGAVTVRSGRPGKFGRASAPPTSRRDGTTVERRPPFLLSVAF